jgi:hypothetical protein
MRKPEEGNRAMAELNGTDARRNEKGELGEAAETARD